MAILSLPLPPAVDARALLHHLLEHGDIIGSDHCGPEYHPAGGGRLGAGEALAFDADAAELEDGGDDEPDECQALSFDRVSPLRAYRGRSLRVD